MKRIISFILPFLFLSAYIFAKPTNADSELPSGPKPKGRPSVALVLAGGGAKGFAHLPVIERLEQIGIPIDMVVGTSIGSIIGGLYSAGYTPKEILNAFDNLDWTPLFNDSANSPYENTLGNHSLNSNVFSLNFGTDFSLKLGTGLSNGQHVYQVLKNLTLKYPSNQDFNELQIPFRAVVTNMLTGEAMVLDDGDLAEAIRASMSLPSIFTPTELDGYYFMDGGIRYNLAINVAKNMGYDIIIAVDISQKVRDNPDVYSSNPAVAMLNTITISQYTATEKMYDDADVVIFPDISKFGTLDFQKAEFIYNEGMKILDEYDEKLEEIRQRIYPSDYDENGKRISKRGDLKKRGKYRSRSNLIPSQLKVTGALKNDEEYIERVFQSVYDNELTPQMFEDFMNSIYLTGNYESIRSRVYEEGEETILQLILKKKPQKEIKIVGGVNFTQTIAPITLTSLSLIVELQLRGLTGPGSVLALSTKSIGDYGASLYFMHPFSPAFFMESSVNLINNRYPQMMLQQSFIDDNDFNSYTTMNGELAFGARHNDVFNVRLGGFYKYKSTGSIEHLYRSVEKYIDENDLDYTVDKDKWDPVMRHRIEEVYDFYQTIEKDKTAKFSTKDFGAYLEFNVDALDRYGFAHKGFYAKLLTDLHFCYDSVILDPALVISLDARSAIPLGRKMSINLDFFAGGDILGATKKHTACLYSAGFCTYDRVFFPQITDGGTYGTYKAGAAFTLQFEPWKQLSLFGGEAVIRLTGTAGNVTDDLSDMIPTTKTGWRYFPLYWTGSAGLGIKIKDSLNVFIRVGAANQGYDHEKESPIITPFFAFDIGSILF